MKIIGHRGARDLAPENTMASFEKALEFDIDGLEFDVRVSKDGFPILCHDSRLRGDDGTAIGVSECTYKKLKAHKSDLATLDEVLSAYCGRTELYIEIKPKQPLEPIFNIIKNHGTKKIVIGSFDYNLLKTVRTQYPHIEMFVNERWSGIRATRRAKKLKTKIIDISYLWLWPGFIKAMKKRGFLLYTYNLDNPAKAKRWEKAGLAAAITNFPDRFTR